MLTTFISNRTRFLLGEIMTLALVACAFIACPGSPDPGAGTETGAASDTTTSAGGQTTGDAEDGTLTSSDDLTEAT